MSRLTIFPDCELQIGGSVIRPTFNSALGHLLAVILRRTFEVTFVWVILKCIELGFCD